jgi:hypothetical protein
LALASQAHARRGKIDFAEQSTSPRGRGAAPSLPTRAYRLSGA